MSEVNIDILKNSTFKDQTDGITTMLGIIAKNTGKDREAPLIDSWSKLKILTQAGLAPQVLNIGYNPTLLKCHHERFGDLIWTVYGFNQSCPCDENGKWLKVTENGTIEMTADGTSTTYHLFERPTIITGVYLDNVTVTNTTYDTEYFDLTFAEAPEENATIKITYSERIKYTVTLGLLNCLPVKKTLVGEDYPMYTGDSQATKWLNSDEPIPGYLDDINGFMNGLDEDFESAVGLSRWKLRSYGGIHNSNHKFHLPTVRQIFGDQTYGWDLAGGNVIFSYFDKNRTSLLPPEPSNNADANRIKLHLGSASRWLLHDTYFVESDGSIGVYTNQTGGISPICVIY